MYNIKEGIKDFASGCLAYTSGIPLEDNPNDHTTKFPSWAYWRDGWMTEYFKEQGNRVVEFKESLK